MKITWNTHGKVEHVITSNWNYLEITFLLVEREELDVDFTGGFDNGGHHPGDGSVEADPGITSGEEFRRAPLVILAAERSW